MQFISTLADIGFVIPVFFAGVLMLLARRDYGVAMCWGGGVLLAVTVTGLLKAQLRGDPLLPFFPSGHVSLAVAFYGGLLVILLGVRGNRRWGRWVGIVLLFAAIAAIEGWSRVTLTEHTWTDVAGGFVVGTLALGVLGCPWAYRQLAAGSRAWLAAAVVLASPAGLATQDWLGYALRTMVE
jgi:membrane-associated phospholipid phosphatase